MLTIPASEIKRRGIAAIEEQLLAGKPVHIIKNNKPTCVVLSEQTYAKLQSSRKLAGKNNPVLDLLLTKPATGVKSRKTIDKELKTERDSWD